MLVPAHDDRRPGPRSAPPRPAPGPTRAPALYVLGWGALDQATSVAFRLPSPPPLDALSGIAAAERRVRKAYFATLDALRTGRVDPEAGAKLERLTREARSPDALRALQSLQRAQRFVRREAAGWPVIAAPRTPLARVVVAAPSPPSGPASGEVLARRYGWALDWLRMHRWVAGRGLLLAWRALDAAPARPAPRLGLAA